jgi:hypothetical protein
MPCQRCHEKIVSGDSGYLIHITINYRAGAVEAVTYHRDCFTQRVQ